jgi:diacylglycerol kinase
MKRTIPCVIFGLLTLASCVSDETYEKEKNAKDNARLAAGLFAVCAVITLVVGAALGSKARHAAQ